MKTLSLFAALILSLSTFSQKKINLDSLKKIISLKCHTGHDKKNIARQTSYIKACNSLGDYYKSIGQQKTALTYYLKAADLTDGTDSQLGDNSVPIKLRDKTCMKVGDLYLAGKGIPKDLNNALHYHSKGLKAEDGKVADRLSKLYFGTTAPYFKTMQEAPGDSASTFAVNPIYLFKPFKTYPAEKDFGNTIVMLNSNRELIGHIRITRGAIIGATMSAQIGMYQYAQKIQLLLSEISGVTNRLIIDVDFEPESCRYKSFNLPCMQLIVKKPE